MAAITANDVVVTVLDRRIFGRKRINSVKIQFGDGALTYPSNGVPMPSFEQFGMARQLDHLNFTDMADASGIFWKYDQEDHKLLGWQTTGGTGAGTIGAPTTASLAHTAGGTTVTSTAATMPAHAATALVPGIAKQLDTTLAPGASTFYAEAVGW